MVSAFDRAFEVYDSEPCARPLAEDMFYHLQHGIVIGRADLFLMVRRVRSDWIDSRLRLPCEVDPAGDCLHVWLLAGQLPDAVAAFGPIPAGIEWVTYERKNQMRRVRLKPLLAKIGWDPHRGQCMTSTAPTGRQAPSAPMGA